MAEKKYRLVTRSDFDGLVCAVLLKEMDILDSIKFVHPKDMQDGKVEITENDITTNLPYNSKAHLVFDHHLSETLRLGGLDPAQLYHGPAHGPGALPPIPDQQLRADDGAYRALPHQSH